MFLLLASPPPFQLALTRTALPQYTECSFTVSSITTYKQHSALLYSLFRGFLFNHERSIIFNPRINRGYTFHKPNEQSNQLSQITLFDGSKRGRKCPIFHRSFRHIPQESLTQTLPRRLGTISSTFITAEGKIFISFSFAFQNCTFFKVGNKFPFLGIIKQLR